MVKASKPGVASKSIGSQFTAAEVNAFDTAIDAVIDDYVSQTDVAAQAIASDIVMAAGKYLQAEQYLIPKMYVIKEGANYRVLDSDGVIQYNSTSFEVAMNDEAIATLTAARTTPEVIYVKGDMDVDDTILVPDYTKIIIDGKWTLANGVDDHMIANDGANLAVGFVSIQGGLLDGNADNQGSDADLIDIRGTSDDVWNCSVRDIRILNCRGYGLYLGKMGSTHVDNVQIMNLHTETNRIRAGFHFADNFDSYYSNLLSSVGWGTGGVSAGFWLEKGTGNNQTNMMVNCYSGGGYRGLRLTGVMDCTFSNCQFLDNSRDGIYLEDTGTDYCYNNMFNNIRVMDASQETDDTYDGVSLTGNSHHNIFNGIVVADSQTPHANDFKYGWNEDAATCDYNMIVNSIVKDGQTDQIRVQGVNTVNQHNITA